MTDVSAAAALEVGTAVILFADPSLFSWLLFGAEMTPPGQMLGRLTGVALLALAVACWPRRGTSGPSMPAVQALLLFSALASAGLFILGLRGALVGMLLWPAMAAHLVFALLLALIWTQSPAGQQNRGVAGDGT